MTELSKRIADDDFSTSQKIGCGHCPLPIGLHTQQSDCSRATLDCDSVGIQSDDSSRLGGGRWSISRRLDGQDLQSEWWLSGLMEVTEGARPGLHSANVPLHLESGLLPGYQTIAFGKLADVRHLRFVLRDPRLLTKSDLIDDLLRERNREFGQSLFEVRRRFLRKDVRFDNPQHWSRIQSLHDFHDRDTRFAIAVEDRRMDRRRTAILGKQRGMQVDGPQAGNGEDRFREHLSIRRDDEQVRPRRLQRGHTFRRFDGIGLQNDKSPFRGELLKWVEMLMMATSRSIGLGDQTDQLVLRGVTERLKRRQRQGAGTEKENSNRHTHLVFGVGRSNFKIGRERCWIL